MKNWKVGALGKGEKAMKLVCGCQLVKFGKLLKLKQDLRGTMEGGSFPSSFTFAIAKEAQADEVWEVGGMIIWNTCFSRNFHNWDFG